MKIVAIALVVIISTVLLLGCIGGGPAKVSTGIDVNEINTITDDVSNIATGINDIPSIDDIDVSGIEEAFA
jgi:hypothetical protein